MKALTIATAAALSLGVASASHAAVFAQFSPDANTADYSWVQDAATTGGTLNSGNTTVAFGTTASAPGVSVHFSYFDPTLSALGFIPATFRMSATVVATPADEAPPASGNTWTQTEVSGTSATSQGFSFIYNGPTNTNFNGSGLTLNHGANLLSGVFTNAWIQGAGGSGSTNLTIGNGGHLTFTSDVLDLSAFSNFDNEFAFNLLSVTPSFGGVSGVTSLNSFTANGGGNFSANIPEPGTWALMIMGFGGLGVVLRSRRRMAIANA